MIGLRWLRFGVEWCPIVRCAGFLYVFGAVGLFAFVMLGAPREARAHEDLLEEGFESGGICAWSSSSPAPACAVLESVVPDPMPPGGEVVLSGSGFGADQGGSEVRYGGSILSVTGWGDSQITALLPGNLPTGNYVVQVVVGGVASTTLVHTTSTGPLPPRASFTGTPRLGGPGLNVQFTDLSTAGSSPVTSRLWTFGDGGTSTAANPSHTYGAGGSYMVTLKVTTAVAQDTVNRTGYVSVLAGVSPPVAAFVGNPTSGGTPLQVQFTDQSNGGGLGIISRNWNFGDGGSSSAASPSHTYSTAGTYAVSLTVTTAAGTDSEAKPSYISVSPGSAGTWDQSDWDETNWGP